MKTSACLAALLAITTYGCAKEAPEPTTPPEPFRPIATSKQLMQAIVIPASDGVWGVASEPPKDDAGWLAAENDAIALAESGNLLMMGSRVVDRENWLKYSSSLIDAANTAIEAIRARDLEKISAAGDTLYEVCEACHMQYLPKPPE